MNHFLRIWDFETSQRPDILIANSKNVQDRIKKFYRRDSVIIYPPVEVDHFKKASKQKGEYFLSVSRLVRGKGVDSIIEACTKLKAPLKVVGSGPELASLKSKAGKTIEFLGAVKDEELLTLYSKAKALISASEDEDFGITAVESQATGTPVIAPKSGGYLESVSNGKTGILYGGPGMVTIDSLVEALNSFDETKFREEDCRNNAEKFSKERFKKGILSLIENHKMSS